MKNILIVCLLFSGYASAQVPGYSTTPSSMNYTNKLAVNGSFIIPAGAVPAKTADTWVRSGALFYDSTGADSGLYVSHGAYWVKVGSGTVTGAGKGITLNGTVLDLGSVTALNAYTPITLNGFPLTINHNGVNNAAAPDSNSIRLTNNTLATSISDSNVTTGIGFYGNSWRTTGSTNKPFAYHIDAIGLGGSGVNGLSHWRIRANLNNVGWGTAFAIQPATFSSIIFSGYKYSANITSPLNINGQAIGSFSSNVWFGGASKIVDGTATGTTDNTIMGQSAFNAATSGTHNVAIGELAMSAAISPNFSTAVGFQALNSNDSAYNVGVGYNAMRTNTLGVYNTAVGANALYFNTTGEQNAAFGYNALLNNTTGQKNSAIGPGVMESNTTGSFNTGNGHDALLNQTTGSNNVGIGWLAYGNNITGSLNTVVGFNSFNGVVHGNNNVMVGGSITALNDTINNSIGIGTGVVIPDSGWTVIGTALQTNARFFGIPAGAGTKSVRYDPATKNLTYGDTAAAGGGGGSGTVTSVDPGYGLIGTPDPITTTGTVVLDTTIAMNKAGAQVVSGAKNFTGAQTFSGNMFVNNISMSGTGSSGSVQLTNAASDLLIGNSVATAQFRLLPFGSDIYFINTAAGELKFRTNAATEVMTMKSDAKVGIGTTSPNARLGILSTTEQLRVHYDASNYLSLTVGSTGIPTFDVTGSVEEVDFNDHIRTFGPATFNDNGAAFMFRVESDNNANMLLVDGVNDRVGIGTGSPTSTLHSAGSFATAYRAITALRTLDVTDRVIEVTANTFTVTLPTAVGITGREYIITNSGAGTTTVATTGGQTFVNVTATPTTLTVNQFSTVTVVSNGANWLRTSSL